MDPISKLKSELGNNNWFHAYLLIGNNETQISEIIDIVKEHFGIIDSTVISITPEEESGKAGEIKISQVRELIHQLNLTSVGRSKLALIYHCERLNLASANILLKTLEEPPPNTLILLFADTDNVLATIRSRCRIVRLAACNIDKVYAYQDMLNIPLHQAFAQIEDIAKSGKTDEFLLNFGIFLGKEMELKPSVALAGLIVGIEKIRKKIKHNANPRLAMEVALLKAKKVLYE